ncbi:GyrI-like domain-containing protein [Enterococcus caccae]|uniref:AraC effector-binding domain-containing protein n=1 Tax=Enterococcus caccae ATCC BAA-1240 TaxID=1158612 RepID=R3U994_9ENTE|nr:effector binding domain-containing protein [Enterococcus caccae]EOL50519.1 hypothetical protein UC7_00292 [Enterococcus caccae ATCC BAA-1240]EOT59265.1 hypothetical protein I580_02297 [Enterococcus caccae ATCC BAA-1240]OJG26681.1 hypothetical protein RU98_GL000471 [Enterococcus caccae]
MNYKIEKKEAFGVIGYTQEITKIEKNENFYEISQFWSNLTEHNMNQLMSVADGTVQGILGVSNSNKNQQDSFNYMIGTNAQPQEINKEPWVHIQFPKSDWAVFECIGAISAGVTAIDETQPFEPNNLMKLKLQKSALWSDDSVAENTELSRVECYPLGDMEAKDYRCELWIPIKK